MQRTRRSDARLRGVDVVRPRSALHGELAEVLHEDGERDVVREDHLARCAAGARLVVRHVRVDDGEQEARLAAVLVAHHEARVREAVADDGLRVGLRRLEQLLEGRVLRLVLVALLPPVRNV